MICKLWEQVLLLCGHTKSVSSMGYVKVKAKVSNPLKREKYLELELLVDTGAIYSALPEDILNKLEIKPMGKRSFKVASRELKEYKVGEVFIEVQGIGATSLVVFLPKNSMPLLGVTTLELLGLQLDPVTGKLKPLELLLI